jgi:hypothetical protein
VRQSKLLALAPIIRVAALIFAQSRDGMAMIRCASNRSRAARRVTSATILPSTISWMSRTGTFDSAQAAIDAMASPEGQAGAADVPNYYHEDPLFMFFEK